MIDLHCHLLSGVDDGAATLEDSMAMALMAAQDGVRTIVATPHSERGDGWQIDEKVKALRSELRSHGVDLEVVAGLEVYLTPETSRLHAEGCLRTLNGSRYLLVEFSMQSLPSYAEQVLFELQARRLVPVIAHPERNAHIAENLEIARRMAERGMLLQVTAASMVGAFGARTRGVAEAMVKRRLVHVIASDAHSTGVRSPVLSSAVRRAGELIGEEAARAMVTTLPAAILRDEEVAVPEPRPAQRRSWFPFGRRWS